MKTRLSSVLAIAAVLILGSALVATAAPTGKQAPVTKELSSYFASFGVDPQYLGVPIAQVPADQLSKINDVLSMADDTTNLIYYHQKLNALIGDALQAAADKDFAPVYLSIAGQTWEMETGRDPADVVPAASMTVADPWVPLG